ncbi:MAG: TRAP transporter large permease [Rhizobiaceae bacterium]|nr:TRAP transporter large permease [Rhizobiaceae bacterium]MCV0404960.1 TRAP transporter large permease [Rhizobiaceae bacterium]
MSPELIGVGAIVLLVIMIALRVPIAIALIAAGLVGYAGYDSPQRALSMLASVPAEMLRGYSLSVVPLFVLMGAVASRSGLSASLYEAARAFSSARGRGSLASATIGACAMFGAICGSSIATAATMTRIAVPEMRKAGYSDRLAAGSVAAGGTLGILIPPSVILVIYALLVEESVPALFAAAMLPGLILVGFCIVVVKVLVTIDPSLAAPVGRDMPAGERLKALAGTWRIVLIFGLSLGGIYLGWFSPTEAAAVGAAAAVVVATLSRTLTWREFAAAVDETVTTSAMLFLVFLGALMFGRFIALTRVPMVLTDFVTALDLPGEAVIVLVVLFYLVLGCLLDTVAMVLITVPVLLPLVVSVGYDPVWFGILVVVVAEMGLITPPVGMNIFVIKAQMPELALSDMFKGVLPFLAAHAALVTVLVLFPQVTAWLPGLLLG